MAGYRRVFVMKVVDLYKKGNSITEIAKQLNISETLVRSMLNYMGELK